MRQIASASGSRIGKDEQGWARKTMGGRWTSAKRFASVLRVNASGWRVHTDGQWLRMAKDGHGRTYNVRRTLAKCLLSKLTYINNSLVERFKCV